MAIHDVVSIALLAVITLLNIGRWAQGRESAETADAKDTAAVKRDFDSYCSRHEVDHETLWRELERQSKRWHDDLTPWRQTVAEKLARAEEHARAQDSQLSQLWAAKDRRRTSRDD